MNAAESVLFIDYATTVKLLPVPDAMAICEDVFRMHARNSVKWSVPPSQKLDVGAPFHNHWHVKTVILEDEPIAGVRLYSYYDDGVRNTVGRLDCARYIVLADPRTGHPIAILDEHWTYAIRSAAAAMVALKWLGPKSPRTAGTRRGRHHGRELPALPAAPLPLRRDHLHVAAPGHPRGLCCQMVEDPRHPGAPARQHRRGCAQRRYRDRRNDADRYRQPRAVGATAVRRSFRWRVARWIRRAGPSSTRS